MNYESAIEYISSTHKFGSNYGLERTQKILQLLDNPQDKIKCIHIAGTNGKGSTSAMISNILIKSGYKVGMYTSPYIEQFEERIQINSNNIAKDDLARIIYRVKKIVDTVLEMGYAHPTEFEIITCCMFLYFYEQEVDFAVVETGLGGRLDSTNVITPIACVITSISYDHTNILGDSLEKIALEKAGIIKNKVPLVLYPQAETITNIFSFECKKNDSPLIKVDKKCVKDSLIQKNSSCQNFKIITSKDSYDISLSLLGVHQKLNCAVVIHLMEELQNQGFHIEKNHILYALKTVKWMGRLEIMKKNPIVLIDGAHNIDGIKNLTESIKEYFEYKNLILILGILSDKQVCDMVNTIVPMSDKVIAVSPHSDRAKDAEELSDIINKIKPVCEAYKDYKNAYLKALSYCDKDDLLLVAGSLYLIGDMRKIIKSIKI